MTPMFKENDKFFHPEKNIFVVVDAIDYYPSKGGFLYTLKCFNHDNVETKPWKRYYESRVINELLPLKPNNVTKITLGDNKNVKDKNRK
jgi:hypothetical protein